MAAGLLEFLPVMGPIIAAVIAILAALLQTDIPFNVTPFTYAMIVLAVMIVIQQMENNLLVPRIVGGALDPHPLVVIVGVLGEHRSPVCWAPYWPRRRWRRSVVGFIWVAQVV